MAAYTSAGSTLRVTATAPATFNAAGYGNIFPSPAVAANPVVGEITNLGEFGREYNEITHNPIGTRATQKYKGSYNEGQISLELALDQKDTGQLMLKAASTSDADYYFEIKDSAGNKYYMIAKVMSFKINIGTVDQITTASVMLSLTSSSAGVGVVEVLAA